jgi:hypothetical protein
MLQKEQRWLVGIGVAPAAVSKAGTVNVNMLGGGGDVRGGHHNIPVGLGRAPYLLTVNEQNLKSKVQSNLKAWPEMPVFVEQNPD